jgi:hypothetical protein
MSLLLSLNFGTSGSAKILAISDAFELDSVLDRWIGCDVINRDFEYTWKSQSRVVSSVFEVLLAMVCNFVLSAEWIYCCVSLKFISQSLPNVIHQPFF